MTATTMSDLSIDVYITNVEYIALLNAARIRANHRIDELSPLITQQLKSYRANDQTDEHKRDLAIERLENQEEKISLVASVAELDSRIEAAIVGIHQSQLFPDDHKPVIDPVSGKPMTPHMASEIEDERETRRASADAANPGTHADTDPVEQEDEPGE